MRVQRLLIALTVVNLALLTFSLTRTSAASAPPVASVLRGHALEIVDHHGAAMAQQSQGSTEHQDRRFRDRP